LPSEHTADRLTEYAAIETEQARDARKTADALFKPKQTPVVEDQNARSDASAGTTVTSERPTPRILAVLEPQPEPVLGVEPTAEPQPRARKKQVSKISSSEHARIRTLATYGMTIAEVAEVYDVSEIAIERIVEG
jgi:hypothetical protein